MPVTEDIKRVAEKVIGVGRPDRRDLRQLARPRAARTYTFADDGSSPNNPAYPLLVYRNAVSSPQALDPAAVLEDIFAANGWKDSWRDGIYDFLHFHTATHEVLGVARGAVCVQFGGGRGRTLMLKRGDVVVIPAGTAHQRIAASRDLLVVGAYPAGGSYDEPQPGEVDHATAKRRIAHVRRPATDPLYGAKGPLPRLWRTRRRIASRQ